MQATNERGHARPQHGGIGARIRSLLAVVLAGTMIVSGTPALAGAKASAATAVENSISGVVTGANRNLRVFAFCVIGCGEFTAGENGVVTGNRYKIVGLFGDAEYIVSFSSSNGAGEYFNNTQDQHAAKRFKFTRGTATHFTNINAELTKPGIISGTVKDENGEGILRAQISLVPFGKLPSKSFIDESTWETPAFKLDDLLPGQYYLHVEPEVGSEFPAQYVGGTSPATARKFTIEPGRVISPVNIVLRTSGGALIPGLARDVTTKAVSFNVKTAKYKIPAVAGVQYKSKGKAIAAGTYTAARGAKYSFTAHPKSGYALLGAKSWTFTANKVAKTKAPKFTVKTAKIQIPKVTGISYKLNGKAVTPGKTYTSFTKAKVTAHAAKGYQLSGTASWTKELRVSVSPKKPTVKKSTKLVTVPKMTGVSYYLNGKAVKPGKLKLTAKQAKGKITMTAKASSSKYLIKGTARWVTK